MINKICAIVVTYNREKLLKQCIGFLLNQTIPCDILIIDNASTDNTAEVVKEFTDPRVSYCNTGKNIGGAGGFNFGMKKAVESGYEYIWIMDDDTLARPDTLEQLFNADEKLKGNYGWLSSKTLWTDGNICETNRQSDLNRKPITDFSNDLIQARTATFVSMFFRASVIKELGLPIKDFFIWADDTEYSLRLQRKYSGFVVTDSEVVHAMDHNTTSYATLPPERIPRWFYSIRNEFYIARNYGIRSFFGYYWRYFKHFLQILFYAPGHRLLRIWTLLRGMSAGLFFFPRIEYPETNGNRHQH